MQKQKITAICGAIAIILVIGMWILAIQNFQGFSFTENALSELGTNPESAEYFNYSLIIASVLLIVFWTGLNESLQNNKLEKIASKLFLSAAASTAFIGIFTTKQYWLHFFFSAAFTICSISAITIIGYARTKESKKPGNALIFGTGAIGTIILSAIVFQKINALNELLVGIWIAAFILIESKRMLQE
jgi:hypothetical membrane protein